MTDRLARVAALLARLERTVDAAEDRVYRRGRDWTTVASRLVLEGPGFCIRVQTLIADLPRMSLDELAATEQRIAIGRVRLGPAPGDAFHRNEPRGRRRPWCDFRRRDNE